MGNGFTLNGNNDLTVNGYAGISGNSARSISLWMKTDHNPTQAQGLLGWGDATNRWNFGWNVTGPLVDTDDTNKEQGRFTLGDGEWHHVAVSYQQNSDLNQTMLFVDGNLVDAPNLSDSALQVLPSQFMHLMLNFYLLFHPVQSVILVVDQWLLPASF